MAIGQKFCSELGRGWEVVKSRGLAISLRQFLSILSLLRVAHQGAWNFFLELHGYECSCTWIFLLRRPFSPSISKNDFFLIQWKLVIFAMIR
jgi:hypothetical protein